MQRTLPGALLLLFASTALAVDARQPGPPAVVAGSLTSTDSGAPVRKAQVRLVATTTKFTLTTVTDPSGSFTFSNVPAGEYMLKAWKPGYLDIVLGARRPGRNVPGTRITVAAGQKIEGLALKIPRGGVISGLVTDEFGDPALNVPVRAMKVIYQNGRRSVFPSGNGTTDDLGQYRIASLEPGDYYVAAAPRSSLSAVAGSVYAFETARARMGTGGRPVDPQALRTSIEDNLRVQGVVDPFTNVGYVITYFPGTVQSSGASVIRVGVSQQVGGIDVQLRPVEGASVRGAVLTPEGKPAAAARVQLLDPDMPIAGLGVLFRNTDGSGRFTFNGLAPGSYLVLTQQSQGQGRGELTASATAHAGAPDGEPVTLTLQPGVTVSGRFDLSTLSGVALSKLRIRFDIIPGLEHWESPMIEATPDAEGNFVARGLAPGRYKVVVSGLPTTHHIGTAVFGGVDAADRHLVIERREPVAGGLITFTSRVGEVSGALTNASQDPVTDLSVLLFPADRQLWVPQSRRIHLAQPNPDGTFVFRNLPPGEYRLATLPPPDDGQQFDVEFLSHTASGATSITLGEGQRVKQELRVR